MDTAALADQHTLSQSRARLRRRALVTDFWGILFALPWIIGFVGLFLGPMIASFALSFTYYKPPSPARWAGLANFQELITDPLVPHSLKITTIYALVSVPLNLFLGLAIAVLLNQDVKGMAGWRTLYYMPTVISGVAVALLWVWMFEPRYGVVNYLLWTFFRVRGPNWLLDPKTALPSFFLMSIWSVGGSMLINLAGLQGIPTALYDAAVIDGAGAWRKFWNVTFPMMSPVIFFNMVMGIISAMQSFNMFYIMTKGGPNNATLTYMLYLYNQAFRNFRMSYASALAWLLFIIVAGLTFAIFKWSGRWVYYESAAR